MEAGALSELTSSLPSIQEDLQVEYNAIAGNVSLLVKEKKHRFFISEIQS